MDFITSLLRSGVLTVLTGIPSVTLGLVLLFQLLRLPLVSVISVITEPRSVRLCLTTLILSVLTLALALLKGTAGRCIVFGFAALGFICALVVVLCNISVASRHGVKISLTTALSGEKDEASADVEIDSYTRFEDENVGLSLWKPSGAESGAPVILYIHGGGWMNCSRFEKGDMHHCRYFAKQGYLTVSVDYPLATKERPMYDRQEDTIAEAIRWLREHAPEYGGDMSLFYLTGGSAGGNLALNLTARINRGELDEVLGGDGLRVRAVSVLFPATNITDLYNTASPPFAPILRDMCKTNWGGTPEEYPERYDGSSSDLLAKTGMAPVFTVYGKNDHMVPAATVESFLEGLPDRTEKKSIAFPFADHLCDVGGSVEAQTWRSGTIQWFRLHEYPDR